jgi:predicted nucleotidyltransferase
LASPLPAKLVVVTTDDLLERLAAVLGRRPEVRFALLFGSAASRGPEAARDVDVAVSFARPTTLMERGRLAGALEDAVGREVDLVDLDEASTLLRFEVVKTGRPVAVGDAAALTRFRALVPLEYYDLEPFLEREAAGLRRRLGVTT